MHMYNVYACGVVCTCTCMVVSGLWWYGVYGSVVCMVVWCCSLHVHVSCIMCMYPGGEVVGWPNM